MLSARQILAATGGSIITGDAAEPLAFALPGKTDENKKVEK